MVVDLVRAKTATGEIERSLNARLGKETGKKVLADLKAVAQEVSGKPNGLVEALRPLD